MTSDEYWKILKPMVADMIGNAPLHPDKIKYVKDCWQSLEDKLKTLGLEGDDFRDVNSKLRKQIEDKVLRT